MLPVLLFFVRLALVLGTCACFCHNLAQRRGLAPGPWAAMGALLGPFGIPLVFLAHPPARRGPSGGESGDRGLRPPSAPRPPRRGPSSGGKRPRLPHPRRRVV